MPALSPVNCAAPPVVVVEVYVMSSPVERLPDNVNCAPCKLAAVFASILWMVNAVSLFSGVLDHGMVYGSGYSSAAVGLSFTVK